jgi:hypothetical protein
VRFPDGFSLLSEDGRSILVSLRYLRDANGDVGLTLIFMRDLQVFDHMRRSAAGSSGGNVFKFMADRDIGADFETQRYLSADVERMIVRGSRAMHQGARRFHRHGQSARNRANARRQLRNRGDVAAVTERTGKGIRTCADRQRHRSPRQQAQGSTCARR